MEVFCRVDWLSGARLFTDDLSANRTILSLAWVGFDFKRAFGHRVKVVNDAAMQALGSYEGGRMLLSWVWALD